MPNNNNPFKLSVITSTEPKVLSKSFCLDADGALVKESGGRLFRGTAKVVEVGMDALHAVFDRMAANWPSELVARKRVGEFTGGMVSPKSMANYDSLKIGPPQIKIGRNSGYPKIQLVEWLKSRANSV